MIDFGGGHSIYEIDSHFVRVKTALQPYKNVVLILPSPDKEESIQILHARTGSEDPEDDFDINEHVYTKDKTPEETRDEILSRIDTSALGKG